jgi:hypothetical protein
MQDKCFESIATALEQKQEYTTYTYEDCMMTHYTFPSLIAYMLTLGGATAHMYDGTLLPESSTLTLS